MPGEPFLDDATQKRAACMMGTAAYCAPELMMSFRGADSSLAKEEEQGNLLKADVYSYGVTLWEIMARERPREGRSFWQVLH